MTLLERQARVGRKLLASGNGRCNLSNLAADETHYYGAAAFVKPALARFPVRKTLDFFHALGLLTTVQADGRVYPLSDQANSVVDVLRFALAARGVDVQCGCEVRAVRKKARGWQAECTDGRSFFGDKLIVAAGGCAGRKMCIRDRQELDDVRSMLSGETDEELRELCQEELRQAKRRLAELEQELKVLLLPRDANAVSYTHLADRRRGNGSC